MMRFETRLALLAIAFFIAPDVEAQAGLKIHMHADSGYAADGLLFRPAAAVPASALVLVPDEWGLTSGVIEHAKQFANEGYLVVALDLYRGQVADDAQRASQLASSLPEGNAIHDIEAAVTFLAGMPNARPKTLGVVGWSSGGVYALEAAARAPQVKAVVMDDSAPPAAEVSLQGLGAAVLGNFAGRDPAATARIVRFEQQLAKRGTRVDIKIYPNAERGFERSDSRAFRAEDAHDAEARVHKFLQVTLGR